MNDSPSLPDDPIPVPQAGSGGAAPTRPPSARQAPPVDDLSPSKLLKTILSANSQETLARIASQIQQAHLSQAVARSLAPISHPRARQPLLGGLWRGRYPVEARKNALRMIWLLQQPVDVEPIIAAIWDRNAEIRLVAVNTLGQIGLWLDWSAPQMAHIIHALKIALRHHFPEIRRAAALVLARLSAWEATDALAERLEIEQHPGVREAVALALGTLSSAEAVFPLLDAYEAGEITDEVCMEALLKLGEDAVEPLISVVRRWNVRVISRRIASEALGLIGHASAVDPLLIILSRPHEPVEMRIAAARALAKLGSRSALPMLHWVRREWQIDRALLTVIDQVIGQLEPPTGAAPDPYLPGLEPGQ